MATLGLHKASDFRRPPMYLPHMAKTSGIARITILRLTSEGDLPHRSIPMSDPQADCVPYTIPLVILPV